MTEAPGAVVEFISTESFEIAGRGVLYTGPYPFDIPRKDVVGRQVLHQGVVKTIKGIEWFAVPREPRRGQTVGLLLAQTP